MAAQDDMGQKALWPKAVWAQGQVQVLEYVNQSINIAGCNARLFLCDAVEEYFSVGVKV